LYSISINAIWILIFEDWAGIDETMRKSVRFRALLLHQDITSHTNMLIYCLVLQAICASWLSYSEIIQSLKLIPNSTNFSIGTSFENQSIQAFRIGNGQENIVLTSGIHAREWLSIHSLVSLSSSLPYFSNYTFYIIPVVNPDGYEYSRTVDRMWRKNRQINLSSSSVAEKECVGIDLDRNFEYQYGNLIGSSSDPCAQDYRGNTVLDAPEAKALQEFLSSMKIDAYIDLHSFGNRILYPPSYDCDRITDDADYLKEITTEMKEAIFAINGAKFTNIHGCELYPSSGTVDDFTYFQLGIKNTFVFELGSSILGFDSDPDLIEQTGKEVLAALFVLLKSDSIAS
jgi:carboxypeptidase A4